MTAKNPSDQNAISTINPATGEVLATYQLDSEKELESKLDASQQALQTWQFTSFMERADHLMDLADTLLRRKSDLARLMALEMGKVLKEAEAEVEKSAWACRYFAEHGPEFLRPRKVISGYSKSYINYDPLGSILAIMPWNFPLWQVIRFFAPGAMAGNVTLLKHSPNVWGTAQLIEEIIVEAGFPGGILQNLYIKPERVTDLIKDHRIRGVTLTGSVEAGRSVAAAAGASLKKVVLELGGSDPYIILEDADLTLAAEACVKGRLINAGQSCIAAKRFIVEKKVAENFTEQIVHRMREKKAGPPLEGDWDFGPLARDDLRENLHRQVKASMDRGAEPLLGCSMPSGKGYYYPASVLGGVKPGMPAFDEEIFGPVAAICVAEDEREAVRLANSSNFGLGAAIFSRDIARAERIASLELEAGSCTINGFVASDPRLPFGGVKDSGFGKELGEEGIHEFVNAKVIAISAV